MTHNDTSTWNPNDKPNDTINMQRNNRHNRNKPKITFFCLCRFYRCGVCVFVRVGCLQTQRHKQHNARNNDVNKKGIWRKWRKWRKPPIDTTKQTTTNFLKVFFGGFVLYRLSRCICCRYLSLCHFTSMYMSLCSLHLSLFVSLCRRLQTRPPNTPIDI